MDPHLHVVNLHSDPLNVAAEIVTHQTEQFISYQFSVLSRQEWPPVWSFVFVAHLLQSLPYCPVRDDLTLVVTSSYLNYCSSSQTSLVILLWPLASTRYFCPENWRTLDILSFQTIFCKPWRWWMDLILLVLWCILLFSIC